MTVDFRMQVVLGLLPADAVFLHRYDSDLLWNSRRSGYVDERNVWSAGLYVPYAGPGRSVQEQLSDTPRMYGPRGEDTNAHSYTVPAVEYLGGRRVEDDTPVAVLVDEIIRLRALIDNNLVHEDRWLSAEADASEAQDLCDELAAALIERGHTDECYSGTVADCDCPLRVLGKLPKEQA